MDNDFIAPPPSPRQTWKRVLLVGITLFLLAGLVVTVKLAQRAQELRSRAAGSSVVLTLGTAASTVTVGTPFTVNVSIDPHVDNYSVSGATVPIKYDPTKLTFNGVTVGHFFAQGYPTGPYGTTEMLNKVDTATAGVVKISLGAPCPTVIPAPRGPNDTTPCGVNNRADVFATLSFTPKVAGTTQISFDAANTVVVAIGQTANLAATGSLNTLNLTLSGGATPKYKCSSGACVRDDANGTYTTSNCNNACTTTTKYKCSNGSCVTDPNGTYTEPTCNNSCGSAQRYSCRSGSCVADINGQYAEPTCNNACVTTQHYNCSNGACVIDPNGLYTDATCNNACGTSAQAIISFKVRFEGLSVPTGRISKLKMVLSQSGTVKYTFDGTTAVAISGDSSGIYSASVGNIVPGTYDILVKEPTHLARKFAGVNLTAGVNNQDWSADAAKVLLGGDANNDNMVNTLDFGVLATDYLNANTQATSRADFNYDALVNTLDFAILAGNYGKSGDQ